MPSNPERKRRFSMTYNNYTPQGYVILQTQAQQIFDKYFIAGKEVGEDGTPHLQMYGECTNKYDIVGIKHRLTNLYRDFNRIHIEVAGGNGPQNFVYCSKDNDFFELGSRPKGKGSRTDLADACDLIKSGASLEEVANEYPTVYVKHTKGLLSFQGIFASKRNHMTIGYWLHGATGTGKSRWVHQNFPDAYWKPCLGPWFDGYVNQETVVIDDYRVDAKDHTSLRWLLRLVDRYPLQVPIKGAFVNFAAKRVIITSPHSLEDSFRTFSECYQEDLQQLLRRFPHRLAFDHSVTISNYLQFEGHNLENVESSGFNTTNNTVGSAIIRPTPRRNYSGGSTISTTTITSTTEGDQEEKDSISDRRVRSRPMSLEDEREFDILHWLGLDESNQQFFDAPHNFYVGLPNEESNF